jgi:hypothetical protein
MNMKILLLATSLVCAAFAQTEPSPTASPKGRITLNGFRMPSIGPEYRTGDFSWHAGMYPTIVSKNDEGVSETTWFGRSGMTWWPLSFLFVDVSYLFGLNKDYRNDHGVILNPGLQYRFLDIVVLRLGVAALASPGHALKINPTPGVGLTFAL